MKCPHWLIYGLIFLAAGVLMALAGMPKVGLIESDPIHAAKSEGTIRTVEPDAVVQVFLVSDIGWHVGYPSAITQAVNEGCQIINFPAGTDVYEYSNNWRQAFLYAGRSNVLVIAAAPSDTWGTLGNYDGALCWSNQYGNGCQFIVDYPAHFDLANVIVVNGHDDGEPVGPYSTNHFHVAAPFFNVRYGPTNYWHGNSAACALVTGAAVVVMDRRREDTKRRLLDGVDVLPGLAKHNRSSGVLNLQRSLAPYVTVMIQAATNLADWRTVQRFETLAVDGQRFYRVSIDHGP